MIQQNVMVRWYDGTMVRYIHTPQKIRKKLIKHLHISKNISTFAVLKTRAKLQVLILTITSINSNKNS